MATPRRSPRATQAIQPTQAVDHTAAAAAAAAPRATDPASDIATLTHELQVHQIELESQNEELRRTQSDLAAARDRFVDLFDFAPVGYLTLDHDGRITEINLTGAALLGQARRPLLRRPFSQFVGPADLVRWRQHLARALAQDEPQRIELELQARHGARPFAQIDCLRVAPTGQAPMLRMTLTDITQRQLADMHRRIAANVVEARETERRRVARELHDELGQRLSALKMELSALRQDDGPQSRRIGAMLDSLDEAVATVRRIASELRPLMLDDLGLNAAMDWLARESTRRLGLAITLHLDDDEPPLGEHDAIALFRLVQETLAHIAHQAQATDVGIELKRRPGGLVLTVQDNGTGWPSPVRALTGGDACLHLREQTRMLGGQLDIGPLPGGGQSFKFSIPVPRPGDTPSPSTTPGLP